ncbi:thioredoxin [bacterium]|nr:thioredoxin [bacterium]
MSEIILTDENFQEEIGNHKGVAIIDFWAVWCVPCRMVSPIIEQISEEYAGQIKVGKLNVDENRNIAAQFGIMSIPTIMIFQDGQMVDQIIGAVPKSVIIAKVKNYL